MKLVLLGPPGAGKGTQAQHLVSSVGLVYLASGDILRAERASGTELADQVAGFMDAGRLVPDEIIIEVILNRLPDATLGWLLDGFPRTVRQAVSLEKALIDTGKGGIDGVVEIRVSDAVCIQRISGRRLCPVCNRVYHTHASPPAEPGRCDDDGTALTQRTDDHAEVVKERLRAYHETADPLASYYRDRGLLQAIDGDRDAETVKMAVMNAVAAIRSGDISSQAQLGGR